MCVYYIYFFSFLSKLPNYMKERRKTFSQQFQASPFCHLLDRCIYISRPVVSFDAVLYTLKKNSLQGEHNSFFFLSVDDGFISSNFVVCRVGKDRSLKRKEEIKITFEKSTVRASFFFPKLIKKNEGQFVKKKGKTSFFLFSIYFLNK